MLDISRRGFSVTNYVRGENVNLESIEEKIRPTHVIQTTNVLKLRISIKEQRSFMDDIASELNITNKEGWYNVDSKILIQHGATPLLKKYNGSVTKLLSTLYPEYLELQYSPSLCKIQIRYATIL